ncbi:hypothetical protein HYALB_00006587 [Hymenoscyphus albidus]|uniref:Major facilitator superfamily (MFS) profile domain-containing protein n=1 Tax=Hymenoscyphus albidus TaxID=595503 RepID=A0A9N9LQP6_9HELO|nr:hypothetical protein HYALB_00006587 [Hymenoscyphus albidus]
MSLVAMLWELIAMRELFRDSTFGHVVRLVTRGRVLQFEEESNPSLWERYVDREKSGRMAHHGHVGEEEKGPSKETEGNYHDGRQSEQRQTNAEDNRVSSDTRTESNEQQRNAASGAAVDPEKGRDVTVVTWYGEHDPEHPLNWSTPKKVFVAFLICFLTTSVYIGSSIYSAGTVGVMEQFGVSQVAAMLGLCLFVAGYGLGPMVWAPASEIPQIGRNPVYIGTLVVFVFFQFGVIYAKNFGMLLAFRFLTGFFGSPVLATGGASLGDIYRPSTRAYAIAIWGMAAVSGPVLGPLGLFGNSSGSPVSVSLYLLPETSSANILYRRSRRLRKLTGRNDLKCEPEIQSEQMTGKDITLMVLIRPFSLTFTEPILFLLNLYIALIYGLLYIWFESFAIVFIEVYGFNLGEEGLSFLGIFIGALVFNENGELKPEKRLPPAFVGAFCIPICLFWFGWTSQPQIHWIVPIIGSSFFSTGAFLLFNSVLNYLGDAYPDHAASVFAGNDFLHSSFGAGFPLFANAMYRRLGTVWASSLLGFLSIAFIPIPFVLYFYGERIRKASKRARHDL